MENNYQKRLNRRRLRIIKDIHRHLSLTFEFDENDGTPHRVIEILNLWCEVHQLHQIRYDHRKKTGPPAGFSE